MKNSEQPAFPSSNSYCMGLTKREYFAAMAMQALIINAPAGQIHNCNEGVAVALNWTDELLKQLEKCQTQ